MKELFPGFYEKTEEELSILWQEATFVFDTNMLLNVYRYQEQARKRFFEILEQLKARIWCPHQVIYEYQNNRLGVIDQQFKVYSEVSKAFKDVQELLERLKYLKEKHSFIDIDEITKPITDALRIANTKLSVSKNTSQQEVETLKNLDSYRAQIAQLFEGRIGNPYKKDRLADLYSQAEKRFELQISPGWKDQGKKTISKYGDVILWFQLLDYACEYKRPIIFVTDDVKSDWFLYAKPRPELIQEMLVETGVLLHVYQGNKFFDQATDFLHLTAEPSISADVERVTEQNTMPLRTVQLRDAPIIAEQKGWNVWEATFDDISLCYVGTHASEDYGYMVRGVSRKDGRHFWLRSSPDIEWLCKVLEDVYGRKDAIESYEWVLKEKNPFVF